MQGPVDGSLLTRLLLTHRSPECPEGRDSGFDCLIDLLQTVRQGVPAKLGGRGSVSRRRGGGCGERWKRGGRELGWGEIKIPAPQHEVCRYLVVYRIREKGGLKDNEKRGRQEQKKGNKGKKKTPSTP